ncbi:MAG: hypothetical protein Q9161_008004 [Pseudevernia consocians]
MFPTRSRGRTSAFGLNPRPPNVCVHFITFGSTRGQPPMRMEVLLRIDVSIMPPPPSQLLDMYTGACPELARYFFSMPGHETSYRNLFLTLEDRLESLLSEPRLRPGGCVAVLVNCTAGMHRSVAVAERMARDAQEEFREDGVVVEVEHLDTDVECGIRRVQRAMVGTHSRSVYEDNTIGYAGGVYVGY